MLYENEGHKNHYLYYIKATTTRLIVTMGYCYMFIVTKVSILERGQYSCTIAPLPGGHWFIAKTNIHSIHAGLERGPEFLSIYLSIYLKKREGESVYI